MINNSSNNVNIQAYEQRLFEHFFNNSHTKTALDPKGHLVHENPIQAAGSAVGDLGKDVVNLAKALKDGESNDAALGRMNDLGLKLGAVGIASYLLTRKNTPKAKLMEFVGAGVFISMMSLWQKMFIAAPIKARFGVDINQKYIDSMGRKKELLLDNQYIPALETDEELDKLADNLNLPKDMEYRREYAKELRRKIGLQGRTLNMLTVGVATPVLTALICTEIEKHADGIVVEYGIKSAENKAGNFAKTVGKKVSNPLFDRETGSKIIKRYSKKGTEAVDDDFFTKLAGAFNPANAVEGGKISDNMPDLTPALKQDLEALFASSIDEKTLASDVFELFKAHATEDGDALVIKTADGISSGTAEVRISKDKLKEAIDETMQGVKEGRISYTGEDIIEALKNNDRLGIYTNIKTSESDVLQALQSQYIKGCLGNPDETRSIPEIIESIKQGNEAAFNAIKQNAGDTLSGVEVQKRLAAVPYEFLDDTTGVFKTFIQDGKKKFVAPFMQKVEENYKHARTISASLAGIEDVIKNVDNAFGKEYFNIVDTIFGVMKPDMKTLNTLRKNSDAAADYLQEAIKTIASDSGKYEQLLQKLAKAPAVSAERRAEIMKNLISGSNAVLNEASLELDPALKTLVNMSTGATSRSHGLVASIDKYIEEAFAGIDATKNRFILAIDLEKRIQDGTLKQQWDALQAKDAVSESFEKFVSDCRRIMYKSTYSDFSNTNYIDGNGAYYRRLNDILFNQPLSTQTSEVIKNAQEGLAQSIDATRGNLMAAGSQGFARKAVSGDALIIADYVNSANVLIKKIWRDGVEMFTVCDEIGVNNDTIKKAFEETIVQPNSIKYQKVGKSLKDFAFENASQKYNSKVWMRIFLPVAGVLIGATLLSQIFIGKKNKDQHLYMEKQEHSGAVNGNRQ